MNRNDSWLVDQDFRISPYNDKLIQSRNRLWGSVWVDYWSDSNAEEAKKRLDRLEGQVRKLNESVQF